MSDEQHQEVRFPYLQSIHVNDCFTYQDFDIEIFGEGEKFKHLILTGKNGSGKTTILRSLAVKICGVPSFLTPKNMKFILHPEWKQTELYWQNWKRSSQNARGDIPSNFQAGAIFRFFNSKREASFKPVQTATKDDFTLTNYSTDQFKQFIVNKRIRQAFHQINNNDFEVDQIEKFFERFQDFLRKIYSDPMLKFGFADEEFEFYIQLSNGQEFTLDQMSDGYAAFLWILADLISRVDITRRQQKNLDYDPPGIVLIDEPELHLHLELQYEVLPMLTEFFPNVQFIVATHSPAVISSIENATVFDLTTQSVAPSYTPGSSFSELMLSHFGLDNEFGPVADKVLEEAKAIIESAGSDPNAKQKLADLLAEHAEILTPTLKIKLEAAMRQLRAS